jgi:cellulose synthase/poly-beta-1,6-N-acetylglucosamine synthase-like glycosyltransferase
VTTPVEVTVAVVVKDRRELMARCLDAIFALDHGSFEVVVVDNGSSDGTYELMLDRESEAPVPMRVVQDHGSLGSIRNRAVREARGAIVAFTDSDCVPRPSWLTVGAAPFADDQVGVVQGMTVPDPAAALGRLAVTQDLRELTGRYEACNIFYRRQAILDTGGFDETVGFFGEDTVAGWRVIGAGWRAAFAGDAVVEHVVTQPGLGWHLRRGLRYGNWNALVRRLPQLRRELLWHRYFLRPRSAAFTAAVAGVLLARWRRPLVLLALPYLSIRRPRSLDRADLRDAADGALFDAAVFVGLATGSVRHRAVVL